VASAVQSVALHAQIAGEALRKMPKYKTIVTDYEGMQGLLDTHTEQGWRLFCVNPDTWRKSIAADNAMDSPPFEELNVHGGGTQEYSASYYLLVFFREDNSEKVSRAASAQEERPVSQLPFFEE
jgi:hypothetical protein